MMLSHSEVALYQACPRKYRYRYVDKRVSLIPAESLVRGKRMHAALAQFDQGNFVGLLQGLEPVERAMMRGYLAVYPKPPVGARVNVPFKVEIASGLWMVGECDAVLKEMYPRIPDHAFGPVPSTITEHKTTSSDISPGGQYWKRVVLVDPQVSVYSLAFPGAAVLYDVLRKPALRQKQGENEESYEDRCLAAMAAEPEKYFARFTVTRLEADSKETIDDIVRVADQIALGHQWERNPHACFDYGRECEYFGVCFEGRSLDGPDFTDWPGHELEWVANERLSYGDNPFAKERTSR